MKFSNVVLSALQGHVSEEYDQQHFASSTVVTDGDPKSAKENSHSFSTFSKVQETRVYKSLSHRAEVHYEPNKIYNNDPAGDADADAGVDVKVNDKEATDTTIAVSAVATTTAVSGEEECVPPITIPKTSELDAGNLPLSSCSSKKHICINSNNKKGSSP